MKSFSQGYSTTSVRKVVRKTEQKLSENDLKSAKKLQILQFVVIVANVLVIGVYVKKDMAENIVTFVSLVQVKLIFLIT